MSSTVKSQFIISLNISPSPNETVVNINLESVTSTTSYFISDSYSFENNTITMDICYVVIGQQTTQVYSHSFPVTVPSNGDYLFNLNLYRSQTENSCDFVELTDSAALNFSTPLTETVFLSVDEYDNINNQITVFPNPVKANLKYITSSLIEIKSIEFYSILGEKLMVFSENMTDINVSHLSDGLYFVNFNTNKGSVQKRILVNN